MGIQLSLWLAHLPPLLSSRARRISPPHLFPISTFLRKVPLLPFFFFFFSALVKQRDRTRGNSGGRLGDRESSVNDLNYILS